MRNKRITILIAILLLFLSLAMTAYPAVCNYVNQKYASEIVTSYEGIIEQSNDAALQQEWEKARWYNTTLIPGTAEEDAFGQEAIRTAATDYSQLLNVTGNGIMGYVEIPVISVRLPIYHGTDADVLERGVGHLLGSSLPVGGSSTHAILTGHSGMAENKMFTDLEQLKAGDVFYLHVLDETLAYQVSEVNTVEPHETELLNIVLGADLCTLVTCTPYGVNSHRLLVRGSRIPYEEAEAIVESIPAEELPKSSWEEKYIEGMLYGTIGAILLGIFGMTALHFLCGRYHGKYCSNRRSKSTPGYQGKFLREQQTGKKRKRMRHPFIYRYVIGVLILLFLFGAAVAGYPYWHGFWVDRSIADTASAFLVNSVQPATESTTVTEQPAEPERIYAELWADMVDYNRRISMEKQVGLSCAYDYQKPSFLLSRYGLDSEVFGVISIPAMELEMPIYLGATEANMALGAAHMTETSLPIGGENTNTVIAAHRGYNGASYFRYIEKLQVGDLVSIQNLWETLNYRVSDIKIIDPQDVEQILIQPGREMLTLLTCHPYASGGKQRYVVYCDRV